MTEKLRRFSSRGRAVRDLYQLCGWMCEMRRQGRDVQPCPLGGWVAATYDPHKADPWWCP